jgi:hypothetical protein
MHVITVVLGAVVMVSSASAQSLITQPVHLGVAGAPEWDVFEGRTPAGESLTLEFESRRNDATRTLVIRQSDVKQGWIVEVNGTVVGSLIRMEEDVVQTLAVTPGALRDGVNTLRIATKTPEDIVLHAIELLPMAPEALLSQGRLQIDVREATGGSLPARVTIQDADGFLTPLMPTPDVNARQAVRHGVVYTGGDTVDVGLQPGTYTVHVTRGPEYSAFRATPVVATGETTRLVATLAREVPMNGWVSVDTHVHTYELSGHGDATVDERVLTLAGEGVDVAIATEHNRHADYTAAAAAMGVDRHVTVIPGNEVTTPKGHFNVFPVALDARPPNAKVEHWPDLMRAIRSTPAVAVVVLNHPHDLHSGFAPFADEQLHPVTGRNRRGFEFTFDAMEIVNSGAMRSDWMEPVRSWFALLNRGLRVTGVGSSDAHDVTRFVVGQGRTYVRASSGPSRLDTTSVVASLRAGRAVVSLGLFPELRVGHAGPGDLVTPASDAVAYARVHAPDWMGVDHLTLYVNGELVERAEVPVRTGDSGPVHAERRWTLPRRRHDYHLVLVASGPGITDPYWRVARPYQPTSRTWHPAVLGITNPIWVDADGDGVFTSARGYAQRALDAHADLGPLFAALADHDAIVSAHAAELLEERGTDLTSRLIADALAAAAPVVRQGVGAYRSANRLSD